MKVTAGSALPGDWSAGDSVVQGLYLIQATAERHGKRTNVLIAIIDDLGAEGWELVNVTPFGLLFRRRKN